MEKYFVISHKENNPDIGEIVLLIGDMFYFTSFKTTIVEGKIFNTIEKSVECRQISSNSSSPETEFFNPYTHYALDNFTEDKYRLTKINFNLQAGQYYPRVYRPFLKEREPKTTLLVRQPSIITDNIKYEISKLKSSINATKSKEHYPFQDDQDIIIYSVNQFAVLKEMLQMVLNNVSLTADNFKTYGNNLLNLLVVSCIEVENQWKGILREHESIPKTNGFYKTTDYVKLNSILHLDQYEAFFSYYPNVSSFKPFENWDTTQPTKSIAWYDSYNMVKHDSFANINQANLKNVLNSICAVAILFHAQFGNDVPYWNERIGNFIQVKNTINWKLEECIIPPYEINQWTKTKLNIT